MQQTMRISKAMFVLLFFVSSVACHADSDGGHVANANSGKAHVAVKLYCGTVDNDAKNKCLAHLPEILAQFNNTIGVSVDQDTPLEGDNSDPYAEISFEVEGQEYPARIVKLSVDIDINLVLISGNIDEVLHEIVKDNLKRVSGELTHLSSMDGFSNFQRYAMDHAVCYIRAPTVEQAELVKSEVEKNFKISFIFAYLDPSLPQTEAVLNALEFPYNGDSIEILMMDNGAYLGHHVIPSPADESQIVASVKSIQNKLIPENSGSLVLYHVSWCMHCKNAKPEWDAAKSEALSLYPSVKFVDYDCDANAEICTNAEVRGYPTIKIVDSSGNVSAYNSERKKSAFLNAAKTLAAQSVASFKSVADSALRRSETPMNINELLSINNFYRKPSIKDYMILVLAPNDSPSDNLAMIEAFASAKSSSACSSADFMFYMPHDAGMNKFLRINDRPTFKLAKVTISAIYVVENVSLESLPSLIKFCNFSKDGKMYDVKSLPIMEPQPAYLPFYTALDIQNQRALNELEKLVKVPVKPIYEAHRLLYEIDGLVFVPESSIQVSKTEEYVRSVYNQYMSLKADA